MEIGLACIYTYLYTRTADAAAPPVYVSVLYITSGQRSFVILCCDTRMNLRFRGGAVVLDIDLSVSAWYHKARRVLLRAKRLLLLLLLTAESKERRLAVCGTTLKLASNGAETNNDFVLIRTPEIFAAPKTPPLEKHFFSSRNPMYLVACCDRHKW